jgi:hypothetical protein
MRKLFQCVGEKGTQRLAAGPDASMVAHAKQGENSEKNEALWLIQYRTPDKINAMKC